MAQQPTGAPCFLDTDGKDYDCPHKTASGRQARIHYIALSAKLNTRQGN